MAVATVIMMGYPMLQNNVRLPTPPTILQFSAPSPLPQHKAEQYFGPPSQVFATSCNTKMLLLRNGKTSQAKLLYQIQMAVLLILLIPARGFTASNCSKLSGLSIPIN